MEHYEEMTSKDEVDDELTAPDGKDADGSTPDPVKEESEEAVTETEEVDPEDDRAKSADDPVADAAEDEAAAEEPAAAEDAPAATAEPKSNLKWYVVHTYSGHEQKAKRHLESAVITAGMSEMFGEIVVPTEQVTEMKEGKKNTSMRKFLPSYLLVEMEMDLDSRHLVTSCPGITNFVFSPRPDASLLMP